MFDQFLIDQNNDINFQCKFFFVKNLFLVKFGGNASAEGINET